MPPAARSIGSRIAGIPELIREDETGALFPTGDADALAAVLDRVSRRCRTNASPPWAPPAGDGSSSDFSAAAYRQRMLDLYRSIEDGAR